MTVGEGSYQQNLSNDVFLGDRQFNYDISEYSKECIERKNPFSHIRCGDGELWVLHSLLDEKNVLINCPWSNQIGYCGITLPNNVMANRLKSAYNVADVVGIFNDPWTIDVFTRLNIQPKNTNYAFSNIGLPMHKPFIKLIKDYKPLLVGQYAKKYEQIFKDVLGIQVCGAIIIDNYTEIDRTIDDIGKIDHDIAFLSCAVPAKIIAVEAMLAYGKVYLDIGHCIDNALNPVFEHCWLANFED